jgi:hypothetical protein
MSWAARVAAFLERLFDGRCVNLARGRRALSGLRSMVARRIKFREVD